MIWWGVVAVLLALMLCSTSSGSSASPLWNLPYETRPLVQEGGENLLPSLPDEQESPAWHLSDGASVRLIGGERVLHLGPDGSFSVTSPVTGGRLYVLELQFVFDSDTVLPVTPYIDGGLNGWVVPIRESGEDMEGLAICEVRVADTWQQHRSYFYAESPAASARVGLGLRTKQGGVAIRRMSLREVAASAEDGLSVVNTGKDEWGEMPRQPEPSAPAGAVVYHRRDPDRLFPYSAPAEDEVGQPIELSGTPGEVLVAVTGLFSPQRLDHVVLSMPDLASGDGGKLSARFDWSEVRYTPRKPNGFGRGRTFELVADSLWSRPNGSTADAGQTTVFWLRFTLPADAAPGDYQGTLKADTPSGHHSLPIRLHVLPFRLADVSSRTWGLFVDAWRWAQRTDEQVLREMADLRAHGVESVFVYGVDVGEAVWLDDRITDWRFSAELERVAQLIGKAEFRGPTLVELGGIPKQLARHLGVDPGVMRQHADKWPTELETTHIQALRAFDTEWKARGWGDWVYVGLDEPGYWNPGTPELFKFQYGAAAAAGVPSFCTSNELPSDPIGRPITYHCPGTHFTDAASIVGQYLKEAKEYDQHIWFYAAGSYDGQAGKLLPNRWATGFLFYKTGAEGTYCWTFQRPRGPDPFDDFYQTYHQWCITYPDPEHEGENLDTPAWEAIRQGWYDYRYVATLAQAIERAKQQREKTALALTVERELGQLLDSMPWSAVHASVRQETNATCDEWRGKIAEMILRLES